jgi:hypothetical protein
MSLSDLRTLLDDVPDTREIILRREAAWSPVLEAWRDASEEAAGALQEWRDAPGDRVAFAVYRAAQDREDAAQDALAQGSRVGP